MMAAPAGGSVRDTPRRSDGYNSRKSKVLKPNEVEKFIKEAPDSQYLATKKLEYKLHRRFRVFNQYNFIKGLYFQYSLVASSPKHGILFVASTDGLLAVYGVAELLYSKADPSRVTVKLPEEPTHIAVNCDGELLAVGGNKSILIYNVKDFRNQDPSPKLSVPRGSSSPVCGMQWSPSMNETLAIGFYDCKITSLHSGTGKRNNTDSSSGLRCLSWRPSGSSLVVGDGYGTLRVYSPDLSLEKHIPVPAPPLFGGAALWVKAVHWMCNNQFAVIYCKTGTQGRESAITLINAPEGKLPPRAEYVGRLESGIYWPRYYLLQIKPWNVMLCAASRPGIKLLPSDSDGGGSQAAVQLVSELLPEDDLCSVGMALDTFPVLRQSSQSHRHEPADETLTLVHVLTQRGDLATYTVGKLPSTPSVDTKSSRTTPCPEPAVLEPPLNYSNKEAAECAAPVAEHEDGARARAALDELALARLSRLTLAQDPLPAPAEEQSPGGAPASFCGPCAALVGPAERKRHARSLPHRGAVFAERELEELVREYVDEQDLALLGPPAASQADDALVELSAGVGWYRCELCALRVPCDARMVHERGRRHGACAALAHAALCRAATRLRRPGPLCGARVSDRGLRALLQLYAGEDHGTGADDEGDRHRAEGDQDEAGGDRDTAEGDHLHNVD